MEESVVVTFPYETNAKPRQRSINSRPRTLRTALEKYFRFQ